MRDLEDINDDLIIYVLDRLRILNERIARNPDARINYAAEIDRLNQVYNQWLDEAERVMEERLARSYLKGINRADRMLPDGAVTGIALLAVAGADREGVAPISQIAQNILKNYPSTHTTYSVFEKAMKESFEATRLPVIRSVSDKIQEIGFLATDSSYRSADPLTRRQLSQQIMDRFVKEGVTGISRRDGTTMRIDTYSEMLARSQTLNAAREANINRIQERGNDLVLISVHYPCSDLCENYQGRIFSISGESEEYPALDDATEPSEEGHLFHWNCRHTMSPYTEGLTTVPKQTETDARNQEMYEAEQRQRAIERNIREWKRREVAAITDVEKDRAKRYVESWQKRRREHIDANKFLRRDYSREQIAI